MDGGNLRIAWVTSLILLQLLWQLAMMPEELAVETMRQEPRPVAVTERKEVSRSEAQPIVMEATAYCLRTPTATGEQTAPGFVAVDPAIIPLYSELYIEGYGKAIAMDTGGDIRGQRIDLWMPDRNQCLQFGRQPVKVWIIKEGGVIDAKAN